MKIRTRILAVLFFLFGFVQLWGQGSAVLVESIGNESDIRSGGDSIKITLTGDTLQSNVGSNTAAMNTFLNGMRGQSATWDDVLDGIDIADVVLDPAGGDSVVTITLDAVSDYYIDALEEITFVIPVESLLRTSGSGITITPNILVANEDPVVTISSESFSETAIRNSDQTFSIFLTGDIWEDPLSVTYNSYLSTGGDWDIQIQPTLTFDKLSDTELEVTIPQNSAYNIDAAEAISVDVDFNAFQYTSSGSFSTANQKSLTTTAVTFSSTATFDSNSELDLRTSGGTFAIEISMDDSLLRAVESDNALRTSLVRGIEFSGSQESAEAQMEDAILAADFGATNVDFDWSSNTVEFSFLAISNFNITANTSLSFVFPASLLKVSSANQTLSNIAQINRSIPSFSIAANPDPLLESSLNGAVIGVKLSEENWLNASLSASNFPLSISPSNPGISVTSVTYRGVDSCDINLAFSGNISDPHTLNLGINAAELSSGVALASASNSISIEEEIEPDIQSLEILGGPYGIGDDVVIRIIVDDDKNASFTLGSGTIAGRVLDPATLTRVNNTLYTASFEVLEGSSSFSAAQNLPVSNLQLFNGALAGNVYSSPIVSATDEIDAIPPSVTQVTMNAGSYKIGDVVTATILCTESDLTLNSAQTSINNIPLSDLSVDYVNAGSGIYQLLYTIQDGPLHNDVVAPSRVPVNIVFSDGVGNENDAIVAFSGDSPEIDASRPEITVVNLVSQGVKTPDSTIVIDVSATEPDLVFGEETMVNGVALGPPGLTFTEEPGNIYRLNYLVASDDEEVADGALEVNIQLVDPAGNSESQTGGFDVSGLSIITEAAEAIIFGGEDICVGETGSITIRAEGGQAPYEVVVRENGTVLGTYNFNYELDIDVSPAFTAVYTIESLSDNLGIPGTSSGSTEVEVHPLPTPEFDVNTRDIYAYTDLSAYTLAALPAGGVFSGRGVVSSESSFYPSVAGISDSLGHDLVYTYETVYGCVNTDTFNVTVIAASGQVEVETLHANREVVCYNDPDIVVSGNNVDNEVAVFELFMAREGNKVYDIDVSNALIPGSDANHRLIDLSVLDNLSANYEVRYTFQFKGSQVTLTDQFNLDYVDEISFSKSLPSDICSDEDKISLEASPSTNGSFLFSGPGVEFEGAAAGYKFYPALGDPGDNIIQYEYTSNLGCTRSDQYTITNFEVPELKFVPTALCISPIGGGPIDFINETLQPDLVSKWIWEYDDLDGENNFDTISGDGTAIKGYHYFSAPGSRLVTLDVVTKDGCDASYEQVIEFAGKPKASIKVESNCWIEGETTTFINQSDANNKPWDSFTWNVSAVDNSWDTLIVTTEKSENAEIKFPSETIDYEIDFIAINVANDSVNCMDDTIKTVVLKPTESFEEGKSLFMDFEDSQEKWSLEAHEDSKTISWKWGEPEYDGLVASEGGKAMYTKKDTINKPLEDSWIQSRCFDFSKIERPMIRMDMLRSFEYNRDGAVLQYTLDDGSNWKTVGNIDEGINWYNSFEILNSPGGGADHKGESAIGWSGKAEFYQDSSWVTVAHDLDDLVGEQSVIFGIFYAADDSRFNKNQGLAIDNIYIGERQKKAVIEHFTDAGYVASEAADDALDAFVLENEADVVSLQYHMHFSGDDFMNEYNPAPASSRSLYYGISEVPFAILDGGIGSVNNFDFSTSFPDTTNLRVHTLEEPEFSMSVTMQGYSGAYLRTSVKLLALKERLDSALLLQVAVCEKLMTSRDGYNGDSEFRNVVLDMLPTAAGTEFQNDWHVGDSIVEHYRWNYQNVEDADEIMIVAFLQDKESGEVLQVESMDVSLFNVEVAKSAIETLKLYPNPASSEVFVDCPNMFNTVSTLEIIDVTGRIVVKENIEYKSAFRLDIQHLSPGLYTVLMKTEGAVVGKGNLVHK